MDKIVVNNVEISFDDKIPAEQKGNAIAFAMEFVNRNPCPIVHAFVQIQNGKFTMDYTEKVGNGEVEHTNYLNAKGEVEEIKFTCIGGWGKKKEEPAAPPPPAPAYPDRSEEILEAMENVAHQTERVADELWWQSFLKGL